MGPIAKGLCSIFHLKILPGISLRTEELWGAHKGRQSMRDPQELSISHPRITQGPSLAANNCHHLWPQNRRVPASFKEGSEHILPLADPDAPEFTLSLIPEHCRKKCPIQQERPSDRDDVGLCVHASRAPFCLDARNGRAIGTKSRHSALLSEVPSLASVTLFSVPLAAKPAGPFPAPTGVPCLDTS